MGIAIKRVEKTEINKQIIEQLATVLTYSTPENFKGCVIWWEDWFSNKIPGNKLTIIAEKQDNIIGVARFWKTPFCNNKWLIEGLEVIPPERRKGIGKCIVMEGISILREKTKEQIFVHIANKNIPSIKLHQGIGFNKVSNGAVNSYGDFRGHVNEYILGL